MGKKPNKLVFKLILTTFLFCFFVLRSEPSQVYSAIIGIYFPIFVLSLFIGFIAIVLNSYKWNLLLPNFNYFKLLKLNIVAQYYSTVLPGQIAGEGIKAYILSKGQDDKDRIVTSILIDKITGIIGLLILSILGLFLTKEHLPASVTNYITLIIFIGFLFLFSLRFQLLYEFLLNISHFSIKRIKWTKNVCIFIEQLLKNWHEYSKNTLKLIVYIILGAIYQLINIITIIILTQELAINISFFDWCWIFGVLSLILFIPITFGGLGLREGTLIGLLGWLGISQEKALALSLSIFGIQVIFAILGGILDFQMSRKKI